MIKILDKKLKGFIGKEENKKQIILTHTSRKADDYLIGLRYRHNKRYNKLPHYIITNEGIVLQTMDDENYGRFFNNPTYDKQSIIVSLENLGWLEKEPLKKHHINWIGSIYKGKVFDKKWRDYFFWEQYKKVQLDITAKLCKDISRKFKFEPICIGHNTKTNHMETFSGIISRSNIDEDSTDLSPAFDFDYFIKKLEDE
jgi:hypothetical protein